MFLFDGIGLEAAEPLNVHSLQKRQGVDPRGGANGKPSISVPLSLLEISVVDQYWFESIAVRMLPGSYRRAIHAA